MKVQVVNTLLLFVAIITIAGCLGDDYYNAAVVDYYPTHDTELSDRENVMSNTRKYVKLLESVKEPLDIIVFPEMTLSHRCLSSRKGFLSYATTVPEPNGSKRPCNDNSGQYEPSLVMLSCAAMKNRVYLSANMVEKSVCDRKFNNKCAPDGYDIYNTNVVFDRNGKVVSRYRKFNLFEEHTKNTTVEPEAVPFETDFGVKFGVFICFDIMFDKPTRMLLEDGVKHFIYPTMWFSELPLFTSIQTQQMWSYENDVVLLAAGANIPETASGGSGIYQGKHGSLATHFVNHQETKILVHRVQKNWNTSDTPPALLDNEIESSMDDYPFLLADMKGAVLVPLDLNQSHQRVCTENNFCCDFTFVAITNAITQHYHLVAYNRVRALGVTRKAGLQFCALLNCDENHCGVRISSKAKNAYPVTFERLVVSGLFPMGRTAQYPNSLTSDYIPIPAEQFEWKSKQLINESATWRSHELLTPRDDIYAFAIFGREYNKDN